MAQLEGCPDTGGPGSKGAGAGVVPGPSLPLLSSVLTSAAPGCLCSAAGAPSLCQEPQEQTE